MGKVSAFIAIFCLAGLTAAWAQQSAAPQAPPDSFYTGTVAELTSDQITVTKTILGKPDKRTFQITPDTKVQGKLHVKVRVRVRYHAVEDGYLATGIVVTQTQQKKGKR